MAQIVMDGKDEADMGKGLLSHTTHRVPVRTTVVVGRADTTGIEVEGVRVVTRVHGRGPVVAAGALKVERAIAVIDAASVSKVESSTA